MTPKIISTHYILENYNPAYYKYKPRETQKTSLKYPFQGLVEGSYFLIDIHGLDLKARKSLRASINSCARNLGIRVSIQEIYQGANENFRLFLRVLHIGETPH